MKNTTILAALFAFAVIAMPNKSYGAVKYYKLKCLVQVVGMSQPEKVKIKNDEEVVVTEGLSINQYVITSGWLKDSNMLCVKYRDEQGAPVSECSMLGSAKNSTPNYVSKVFDLKTPNAIIDCRSYKTFIFVNY